MKRYFLLFLLAWSIMTGVQAQDTGISTQLLERLRSKYQPTASDKALDNAVAINGLKALGTTAYNNAYDTYFSHKVKSKGITDQKRSGRCWLFTCLNVMRAKAIAKFGMGDFSFSQNYCFFYDQLEKSNLFLQSVIDNASKPMDDRFVEWLFKNPISDGGQFTGISDIITKYGVVPAEAMPETFTSNNTSDYAKIISLKLREYGLTLRALSAQGKSKKEIQAQKEEMLSTVYRLLVRCYGMPPKTFSWTLKNAKGEPVSTKEYTPLSFYQEFVGTDLKNSYVMFMNDPTRPYYKNYTIDMDRHTYDGQNWTYVNVPMDEIREMAISSIKDSTMMYMSCDVGKELDSKKGFEDAGNYCYANLLGTTFPMNKKERIQTFASGSSHAMTLMAVDIDPQGKPRKWMVENSWGADYGYKGHIIMTDEWFGEYVFRLVVDKKYIPQKLLDITRQKPEPLPAWDPMFAPEP